MAMCYTVITLLIGLALAGCATPSKTNLPNNAQVEIDQRILDASQKIQAAQADLYQAGALNNSTAKLPISILDGQRITLSWQGDALQLASKLAHDRGLEFSFMGVRMPLPVNVQAKDAPYDTVVQMLQAQIGYRAVITQYPGKMILQYNSPQP